MYHSFSLRTSPKTHYRYYSRPFKVTLVRRHLSCFEIWNTATAQIAKESAIPAGIEQERETFGKATGSENGIEVVGTWGQMKDNSVQLIIHFCTLKSFSVFLGHAPSTPTWMAADTTFTRLEPCVPKSHLEIHKLTLLDSSDVNSISWVKWTVDSDMPNGWLRLLHSTAGLLHARRTYVLSLQSNPAAHENKVKETEWAFWDVQ